MVPSPSPSLKIQIMGGKVGLGCKSKTLLGFVNKLFRLKSLLTTPSNVLPKKIRTKNSNVHDFLKVMGLNLIYLLKSSLLVQIFWGGHKNLKNYPKFWKFRGSSHNTWTFFSLFLGSSGASTISSQNSMSGSYCLCVAVKRQVIIYEITRLKSRHKRLREVLLPAQAQSLDVFSEGRLCVGYQSGNFELD